MAATYLPKRKERKDAKHLKGLNTQMQEYAHKIRCIEMLWLFDELYANLAQKAVVKF